MFSYVQTFCAWLFTGADQSVIDFFSVLLTAGVGVLALTPIILIVRFIFKGR